MNEYETLLNRYGLLSLFRTIEEQYQKDDLFENHRKKEIEYDRPLCTQYNFNVNKTNLTAIMLTLISIKVENNNNLNFANYLNIFSIDYEKFLKEDIGYKLPEYFANKIMSFFKKNKFTKEIDEKGTLALDEKGENFLNELSNILNIDIDSLIAKTLLLLDEDKAPNNYHKLNPYKRNHILFDYKFSFIDFIYFAYYGE